MWFYLWVLAVLGQAGILFGAEREADPIPSPAATDEKLPEDQIPVHVQRWVDEVAGYVSEFEWICQNALVPRDTADIHQPEIKAVFHDLFSRLDPKLKIKDEELGNISQLLFRYISPDFNEKKLIAGVKNPSPLGFSIKKHFVYDATKNEFVPVHPGQINSTSRPPMVQFLFDLLDRYAFEQKEDGGFKTVYGATHNRFSTYTYQSLFNVLINITNAYGVQMAAANELKKQRNEAPLKYENPLALAFAGNGANRDVVSETNPVGSTAPRAETGASSPIPVAPSTASQSGSETVSAPQPAPKGFRLNDAPEPEVTRGKPAQPQREGFKFSFDKGS